MALKLGAADVDALALGATLIDAAYLGADLATEEEEAAPGAFAAEFSSTQTMERSAALTGETGTYTKYLLSFWHFVENGLAWSIARSDENGFFHAKVDFQIDLAAQVDSYDSGFNGDTVNVPMAAPVTPGWVHVVIAYDSTDDEATKAAVNGVLVDAEAAFFNVGAPTLAGETNFLIGNSMVGKLSEFYLAFDQWLDLTVSANIEKFIVGGLPANLGADGSAPTGVQPTIYFGNGDFENNLGTGGNFTVQAGEGFEPAVVPGPAA